LLAVMQDSEPVDSRTRFLLFEAESSISSQELNEGLALPGTCDSSSESIMAQYLPVTALAFPAGGAAIGHPDTVPPKPRAITSCASIFNVNVERWMGSNLYGVTSCRLMFKAVHQH